MEPAEHPLNAGCCHYPVVASNKSPAHASWSCKRKGGSICFRRALEKRFKTSPRIFASPWLEDRPDQICGSERAVCSLRAVLSSQRMEKFLFRRSGRGPRGVTQLWSYSCPAPRPVSCDTHWGTHVCPIQTQGLRRAPTWRHLEWFPGSRRKMNKYYVFILSHGQQMPGQRSALSSPSNTTFITTAIT